MLLDVREKIDGHGALSQYVAATVKQFIAAPGNDNDCVRSIKDTFAENLRRLMAASAYLDTPGKLAKVARWPRGAKAGELVSERMLLYATKSGATEPSPTLDLVEAVAVAFGVEPWELVTDQGEARRQIIERLLAGSTVADSRMGEKWRNPDSPPVAGKQRKSK